VVGHTLLVPYRVERFDARPWADETLTALFADAFPAFITADRVARVYIERVRDWFGELNVMLLDGSDQPVATGWGVPIRWTGEVADLPSGYTDTTRRAVELRERGEQPDTFVICGGIVSNAAGRRGVAEALITALRDLPAASSLPRVLAPVRPTLKPTYPLIPIETFAGWQRPDGLPLDPWLRTHVRAGGAIIATAPHSQVMSGTVADWESWSGQTLPSTGHYVIQHGLSTLYIDREQDLGTYVEPNVWVQHR
jgi:hypothetical protein